MVEEVRNRLAVAVGALDVAKDVIDEHVEERLKLVLYPDAHWARGEQGDR